MGKWDDEPHPTHPVGTFSRPSERKPCVFCPDNWDKLDIVERYGPNIVFTPLDPVVPGHVLVISPLHTEDAGKNPEITSSIMATAALHAGLTYREFNIITSAGPNATQTVMHTHVHIVPRRENDGLPLPWTPQHLRKEQDAASLRVAVAHHQQSMPRMSYLEALNAEQDAANARALTKPKDLYTTSYDAAEGLAYDDD